MLQPQLPFLMRAMSSFTVTRSFLAQRNSVASIARPIGITTTAGPGNTIMAIPTARIEKPITITITRLACATVFKRRLFTAKLLESLRYSGCCHNLFELVSSPVIEFLSL